MERQAVTEISADKFKLELGDFTKEVRKLD
jgi:hypothetical protein